MHLVSILSHLSITVWQISLFTGIQVYKMPCAVPGRQVCGCWVVRLVRGGYRMDARLWGPPVAWWWAASALVFWLSKRILSCCDIVGEEQDQVLYPYWLLQAVPSADLPKPMPTCNAWCGTKQGRERAGRYVAWMTRCRMLRRAAWPVSVQPCACTL